MTTLNRLQQLAGLTETSLNLSSIKISADKMDSTISQFVEAFDNIFPLNPDKHDLQVREAIITELLSRLGTKLRSRTTIK